jgi:hypothetical protein
MLRVINIQVWRDNWGIRARNADRAIPTRSKHSQQPRGIGQWPCHQIYQRHRTPADHPKLARSGRFLTQYACLFTPALSLVPVPEYAGRGCVVSLPTQRLVSKIIASAGLLQSRIRWRAKKNHGFSVSHHSLALTNSPTDGLIRATRPMRDRHARPHTLPLRGFPNQSSACDN